MQKINENQIEIAHLSEYPFIFSQAISILNQSWKKVDDIWLSILGNRLNFDVLPQTLILIDPSTLQIYGICCLLSFESAPKIVTHQQIESIIWLDSLIIHEDYRYHQLGFKFLNLIESHIHQNLTHGLNFNLLAQTTQYSSFFKKNNFKQITPLNYKEEFLTYQESYTGTTWFKQI